MLSIFFLQAQEVGLKRMRSGNWFTRAVLVTWIVCAVIVFVVFKNMELLVHGQLYDYGLIFSPDWADPYRILTWLIYICLGLPSVLSGAALVLSFSKAEKVVEKRVVAQRGSWQEQVPAKFEPYRIVRELPKKVESEGAPNPVFREVPKKIVSKPKVLEIPKKVVPKPIVREEPKKVENLDSDGISCSYCHKVFHRALVMFDFQDGKNQLVSVCPYCNHILGSSSNQKCSNDDFIVDLSDKEVIH